MEDRYEFLRTKDYELYALCRDADKYQDIDGIISMMYFIKTFIGIFDLYFTVLIRKNHDATRHIA